MWRFYTRASPDFVVDGEVRYGRVIAVDDTDCIRVTFPHKGKMYRWKCKFDGMDLPVYNTKDPTEKAIAKVTRAALRDRLLGKLVNVSCGKFDTDKKLLVDIQVDGKSTIEWLNMFN